MEHTLVAPIPGIRPANKSKSELELYLRVVVLSVAIFAACYIYTTLLNIPGVVNKSVADTSIILIALSMWVSSLNYFFNAFDSKIVYRKQLGLVGFAFGVAHIILSFSAFQMLFNLTTWTSGRAWAPLAGFLAALIFLMMTYISRRSQMLAIGVMRWRTLLRTGYIAMLLVWLHVVLLKYPRWVSWYKDGIRTLPSISMLESIFILLVVFMRVLMWWRIRATAKSKPQTTTSPTV